MGVPLRYIRATMEQPGYNSDRSREHMTNMKSEITLMEAQRALIIDFEGTMTDPPSLLGVLYVKDGENSQTFNQYVSETNLYPAGEPHPQCINQDLPTTLANLSDLARDEDRILVAWSSREIQAINEQDLPAHVKSFFSDHITDARKIARRWKRLFFPDVEFQYITGQGRHRLSEYMKLIGYPVPRAHGPGNTGQRIRYVRQQLIKKGGNYSGLTSVAKAKWTNMLKHNWHDCGGLREIFLRVVTDLGGEEDNHPPRSPNPDVPSPPHLTRQQQHDSQTQLFKYGYRIRGDNNKKISRFQRWKILSEILGARQMSLEDIAETITSHIKIRKTRNGGAELFKYSIQEWEHDLTKLREEFYQKQTSNFDWPATNSGQ